MKNFLALGCFVIQFVVISSTVWSQTNSIPATAEVKSAQADDLKLQDIMLKPFPFVFMEVVDGGALLKLVRNDTRKPYFFQVNATITDPDWAGYKLISFTSDPIPTIKVQKGSGKVIDLPLGKAVFSDVYLARLWAVSSLQMYMGQAGGILKVGDQSYEVVSVENGPDGKPKVILKKSGVEVVPPLIEGDELTKLKELLKTRQAEVEKKRAEAEKKRAEELEAQKKREEVYKEYPYLKGTYRMSEAAIAQKRARDEKKPLVWISTGIQYMKPMEPNTNGGSHGAAVELMKYLDGKPVVMIFHDAYTETHREPMIVDKALRTPSVAAYINPRVIILNPSITKVLGTMNFNEDFRVMVGDYQTVLSKALADKTWLEEEEKLPYPPPYPGR